MRDRLADLDIDLFVTLAALLKDHNSRAPRLGDFQPALSVWLRLRLLFDNKLSILAASGRGVVPSRSGYADIRGLLRLRGQAACKVRYRQKRTSLCESRNGASARDFTKIDIRDMRYTELVR